MPHLRIVVPFIPESVVVVARSFIVRPKLLSVLLKELFRRLSNTELMFLRSPLRQLATRNPIA